MSSLPIAARVDRWLDRHLAVPLGVLAVACGVIVLNASRLKPFWHDEIYTILMSRLPSLGAIWQASLAGVDLSPPLNLLLTRAVQAIAGVGHVQTRIPAFLGFAWTVFIVFAILLRRTGPTTALTGALLPFLTAGLRYASEARGYAVMMALAAGAMYCWMEASEDRARKRNLALLTLALAASIWNHYFGLLAFAPIIAGECARAVDRGRIDRGVAIAITLALAAATPLYPLIRASASQRSTFWSRGTTGQLAEVYQFVLTALLSRPIAVAALAIVLILVISAFTGAGTSSEDRRVPAHEAAAIAAAVAIPLLAVLLGRLVTGVFVPRYALSSVAGVSVAIPLILWRCNNRRTVAELVLCGTLLYFVAVSLGSAVQSRGARFQNPAAARLVLLQSLRSPSPTVVASSLQFLQLWYYLPPELKPRVRYLADPAAALRWTASDTFDRGYTALSARTVVPVESYAAFVAAHQTFRVYQAGSGWLLDELADAGARVDEIDHENGGRLYQVTIPRR